MERSYIAFISYKHTQRDAAIAKRVHTLIENYVIPKSLRKGSKKLGIVFRDEEELPISSDLTESICGALDASQYLIVICSPESKESLWVAREVSYFLKNHDPANVFVVLVKGEPQDVFPDELTHVVDRETGEYREVEPLAMDVRAESIGASLRKVKSHIRKLYAGMLGCSYDRLVQREKARRMKRFAALAAVGVMLAGSFIGMLFVKNRQLAQKNEQLSEAIELTLSRESELLAAKAEAALEGKDLTAAIRYSIDALYSEDMQRPYSSHAERILFSAMDILHTGASEPLLSKIALEHRAPVADMAYSEDGCFVYTIDAYGTVYGFDASSGEQVWSTKIKERSMIAGGEPQLWYDGQTDLVCCFFRSILCGMDASSGTVVWETDVNAKVIGDLHFEESKQQLAYIEERSVADPDNAEESIIEVNFTVFSTCDGTLLQRIPIVEIPFSLSAANMVDFPSRSLGVFAGPDRFVGTLFMKEDGVRKTQLYTVDLSESTVEFIENEMIASKVNHIATTYLGNDRALVMSSRDGLGMNLQCFDLEAGALLWESIAVSEEYMLPPFNCRIAAAPKETVIAVNGILLAIVNDSGETLAYKRYDDEIVDLYLLADDLFAFTLEDGCCAAACWNRAGITDSRLLNNLAAYLQATPEVIHHNNGFFRANYLGDTLDSFRALPAKDGGGSITYLSEDRCTACVTTVLENPKLPEPVPVKVENPDGGNIGDYMDMNLRGTVLLGPVITENGYRLNMLHAGNHASAMIEVNDPSGHGLREHYYLTEDCQGIIACSSNGAVERIGMDGRVEPLATREGRADAARQTSDGRILAAACDGGKISIWMDGTGEESLQLPEDIRWSADDGSAFFRVGPNGLMILGSFASGEEAEMDHFAVYDTSSGQWKKIEDAAHGTDSRLIAFGQKAPVFAVGDEDMNIRIYDYNVESPVQCIYTGLITDSVIEIGLFSDDQCLYVLTRDGRFMCYDIAAGEMVFWASSGVLNVNDADDFGIWEDPENDRLYLCVNREMLCVDVRSWEPLFGGSDVGFYSAAQNEVFVYGYDAEISAQMLAAIPIPSTSEMIEIARNALS